MTAAVYIRVSTTEQQQEGASLPAQEALCRAECERRGATSVTVYQDAQSAKDTNRPALQSLIADVAARKFRLCVIYDLTRLSRDLLDAISLMRQFDAGGCEVVFLNDPVDTATPTGELFFHLKGALAQFERRQIGQRVRTVKERMVADGKRANGAIPYGYRVIPGSTDLEPDPARAAVALRIFRMYADEGLGGAVIARRLTSDGIPTPGRSRAWSMLTIMNILRAPCHQGMQRSGRMVGPWVFPRIVPADLAARAHVRLTAERRHVGPRTIHHTWAGLMVCGECGSPLTRNGQDGGNRYYRCSRRTVLRAGRLVPDCNARMLRAEAMGPLEDWIRKALVKAKPRARRKRLETDAARQLEAIEERRRRATVAYTMPGSRMSDEEYRAAIAQCDAEAAAVRPPEPSIAGGMRSLGETWEALTEVERNAALKLLVRAVAVYPDCITLHLTPYPWIGWPAEKTFPRPPAKGPGFVRGTMGNGNS